MSFMSNNPKIFPLARRITVRLKPDTTYVAAGPCPRNNHADRSAEAKRVYNFASKSE